MAYLSLYRKHRPRTFAEVVGQEHVTRTLVNAITEDTLHHAYLFTGQRGTGKTSTARILAAAINCEEGPTAQPCGTCDQCVSIVAGNNVDVIELDMASHGGVDDARDLRDRAVFAPAAARRKVYILDEVHMASTAAFNALLKVIEEPPSHVLFAMATTDPQKVLPTIMSRVQRLDLRRVAAADLTAHLRRLGEVEGFTLDDDAAAGVVAAGDGSVRDTLSVLEQVLAFAADGDARVDGVLPVTGDQVTTVLGATPFELVVGVVDAIADADVAAALTRIQELLDDGHDLRRFSLDLARHLRDLLVTAAAPDVAGLVDTTDQRRARLVTQAGRFGTDTLLRAVELVGEVLVEQRQGPPRLPLELAVARLATPGADGDLTALADRVARLERSVAGEVGGVPAPAGSTRGASGTSGEGRVGGSVEATASGSGSEGVARTTADGSGGPAPAAEGSSSAPTARDAPAPAREADESASAPSAGGVPGATAAEDEDDGSRSHPGADTAEGDDASEDAEDGAADTDTAQATDAADADDADDAAAAGDAADDPTDGDEDVLASDDPQEPADLAERARAIADATGDVPPAAPLSERPGTTTVDVEPGPGLPGGDDLEVVRERWDAILDLVNDESRRAKAFYDPAEPIRLGNGVLLLRYPATRRFHAEQAKGGEMTAHLATAIQRSTGLTGIRVDVQLDEDGPRRPPPPPIAGDHDEEPPPEEQAAVAEAAVATPPAASDADEVDRLVRDQLGAQPLSDDE